MTRVVGHLDLDYFYAQVEEVERPSLRGAPVVICVYSGRTENSGVVSTANYKAREFGIKSGMPITFAERRLKDVRDAEFIPMHLEKYEAYSERIMSLLKKNTDVMEQTGIDEAFFDITERTGGDFTRAKEIALHIKLDIFHSEKLTCSIGLGPNKVVAKLASDTRKPDGLIIVTPEQVRSFMATLPVGRLYGIGSKSSMLLSEKKINTIAELAGTDLSILEPTFGRKLAVYMHDAANGIDDDPVAERGEATQLSRILTLKRDSRDEDEIFSQLSPTFDDLHKKIINRKLLFKSVSVIGIRTDLSIRTRSKTLDKPTDQLSAISDNAAPLLHSLLADPSELRRVGIRVTDFRVGKQQSSLGDFME